MPSQKGHSADDHRDISERRDDDLSCQISLLTRELHEVLEVMRNGIEWFKSHSQLATKCDLKEMETKIMSVISDFAAKQKAFNDRQGASIDGLVTSVSGITADVQTLNDKIDELQNSPGGITPEDQALLNDLETAGNALADKIEATAAALKALDEQTPPVVPPTP